MSSIVHGILYFKSGLYADFVMEVYYVLAGLWGLTQWHGLFRDGGYWLQEVEKHKRGMNFPRFINNLKQLILRQIIVVTLHPNV